MPTISGNLNLVTDRPVDSISEVWVRARETRGQGDGLTVGVNDRVSVTDGAVEFTAVPGAAVLVLVQNGMPLETLPMVIGDEAQQSLRLVVQAGEVAGAADKGVIEQLAAEVAANTARTEKYRTEAAASASAAQASQSAASKSASNAKTSETNANTSETNANAHRAAAAEQATAASQSATQAGAARDAAKQSQSAAKTSETNAASHEQAAATSESNAAVHETNAGESATAAASSATEAAGHADRAEIAADPDNLRDEVTQRFADLVDGAPEDLDTIREIAEYAQANRDITDQLNAAIGNKANKSHAHAIGEVTGLNDALNGKADKSHTHAWSSISGRPDIPVIDVGYRIRWADHTPDLYPAGVSVSMSATDQGWGTALAAGNPDYVDDGFVVILTIRNGRYAQSAYQMVFSYTVLARPVYIRKYNGEESGWSNFRKLSDDGHKHTISQVTGLQSELDSRPRTQDRWSYYGRTDSSESNWVFTPIPLPGTPNVTNGNQRITPGVSGIWEIHLKCSDPDRQVEIFTSKGSIQGTGSCFIVLNLDASDYITSYRYGAADGAKIVLEITKLD